MPGIFDGGETVDRDGLGLDEKTVFHDFLVGESGCVDMDDGFLDDIGKGGTEPQEASAEPLPCLRFAPADDGRLSPSDLDAFGVIEDMMVDAMVDAVLGRRDVLAGFEGIGN